METPPPTSAPLASASSAPAFLPAALGATTLGTEDPFAAVLARELALGSFLPQRISREDRGADSAEPQASDPWSRVESAVPDEGNIVAAPLHWTIPLEPISSNGRPISAPETAVEPPEVSARARDEQQSSARGSLGGPPGESSPQAVSARDAPMAPSTPPSPGAEPRIVSLPVTASVSSPRFNEEFSRQVVWIATHELQQAELRLDPPELGPVRVVIHLRESEASAAFSALYPQTREAIEAALPRLKDMLAEAGIALGGATVSAEGFEGWRGFDGDRPSLPFLAHNGPDTKTVAVTEISSRHRHGLVDLFA
jgi:flagellar hook-length control protein FliK